MLTRNVDIASLYPQQLVNTFSMYSRGLCRLNVPLRIRFSYDKSAGAHEMFYKMLLFLEAIGLTLNTELFDDWGYVIVMDWYKNRVLYTLLSFEKLKVASDFKFMI